MVQICNFRVSRPQNLEPFLWGVAKISVKLKGKILLSNCCASRCSAEHWMGALHVPHSRAPGEQNLNFEHELPRMRWDFGCKGSSLPSWETLCSTTGQQCGAGTNSADSSLGSYWPRKMISKIVFTFEVKFDNILPRFWIYISEWKFPTGQFCDIFHTLW